MLLTTVFVFLLRFYKIFKITFSFSKIYFFSLKNSFFSPVIRIWMCFEEPGWHAIEDVSDWFKSHVRNRFRFSTSHLSLCSATYRPWGSLDFLTGFLLSPTYASCETWNLSGAVFQLYPETSFDNRGLPFYMPQTLLLVVFFERKNIIFLMFSRIFSISL